MTHPAGSPRVQRDYVRYRDDLERPGRDEGEVIEKIVKALRRNNEWTFRRYQHGMRDAHAKSHGLLYGELTVYDSLDEHLRQGLFATPATYPVIARLSSTLPTIRSDQVRGVRAIAVKVLGVQGPRAMPGDDATTQDFVLVNRSEFPYRDARAYLRWGMLSAGLLARLPEPFLKPLTVAARAVWMLHRFHVPVPAELGLFSARNTNILGETFHSAAPLRYGDYVAKISLAPLSESAKGLTGRPIPNSAGYDAQGDLVADFFRTDSAEYELRAQLCTDVEKMPIEDATVAWSVTESPPRGVAKIVFGAQDPGTPERRVFADDVLSFNSWRGLQDHRPLGSINRLKKDTYEASSDFRHEMNNVERREPRPGDKLPP